MSSRDDWDDSRSYRSGGGGYTIKQYRVRNDGDDRIKVYEGERSSRGGRDFEETRIVRREGSPQTRIERYDRREPERRERYDRDGYELDRYVKTTEYFPPGRQPREEEDYQVVRRSEVLEGGRVREYSDEKSERRSRRKSSPSERERERDYSSDDSVVIVKRQVVRDSSSSPHRRRDLAIGALAGAGVAEIVRSRSEKQGKEVSKGIGRLGQDALAAGGGALVAEGARRARDYYRSKSRGRDRDSSSSSERDNRHSHRHHRHHRSKSRSKSRTRTLAEIGLGVAALGLAAGAAGYASKKYKENKKEKEEEERTGRPRSRSRPRADSASAATDGVNKKLPLEAGLAGATVAGVVEAIRSRSRSKQGRPRSHNLLKTGGAIAAAGLGSAAAAGLYNQTREKSQERKQAEKKGERRKSRSRSRGPYDGAPGASISDPGLIDYGYEYGDDPVYSYNRQGGYYPPQQEAAMALAPASPYAPHYAPRATETHEFRPKSRDGSPSSPHRRSHHNEGSESDGERRRRRHRRKKSGERSRSASRAKEFATAAGIAAVAGAAGAATAYGANQLNRKKESKRAAEREREQAEAEHNPYEAAYGQGPYSPMSPPNGPPIEPPYQPEQYYPTTHQFPPPPAANYSPQAAYNPANYAQPSPQQAEFPYQGQLPPQGPYSPPPVAPYPSTAQGGRRGEENA